jgi:iron complex transport system ATP-binding protein
MSKSILSVNALSAGYGKKEIIHNISFELAPESLTCLIGKNGCGKTTLMKSVVNQIKHAGTCFLNGKNIEYFSVRALAREVSYIPQRTGMGISLPVLDVVLMGYNPVLKLLERPSKKQIEFAKEALAAVGLAEVEKQDFQTLSEGQKQLVFLARTMIEDTKLLLLDEPDSALDFQNRYFILKELKKMVREGGKAGLLCLHDPVLAMEFCDQLLLMKDGVCIKLLHPQIDSIDEMEAAFREIYQDVSLEAYQDKNGKRHIAMLWEETL